MVRGPPPAGGPGYPAGMATSEDIARRVAERLAPALDATLPALVEQALAGDDDDGRPRLREPATLVGLASFVVSVASLTWSIFKDERGRAERRAPEGRAAMDVAYLRGLVEGRLDTTVDTPRTLPRHVRVAVVEAAATEAVAAGQRAQAR